MTWSIDVLFQADPIDKTLFYRINELLFICFIILLIIAMAGILFEHLLYVKHILRIS